MTHPISGDPTEPMPVISDDLDLVMEELAIQENAARETLTQVMQTRGVALGRIAAELAVSDDNKLEKLEVLEKLVQGLGLSQYVQVKLPRPLRIRSPRADSFDSESLKNFRITRGLTQPQLAEQLGIGRVYLGQIENGNRVPSIRIVQILEELMSVDDTNSENQA